MRVLLNGLALFMRLTIFTSFLFLVIPQVFTSEQIRFRMNPNEGVREALRMALFITLLMVLNVYVHSFYITNSFFFGFLSVVLNFTACLIFCDIFKHLSLRMILTFHVGCIPWNYARFLNHCTERLLLQRVGGAIGLFTTWCRSILRLCR